MKYIYKYQLEVTYEQSIAMPCDAEILSVQVQRERPCIWARVNPLSSMIKYTFRTIGTGQPIDDNYSGKYIGTYQLANGAIVFHVWLDENK